MIKCRDWILKGSADFIKDLLEDEQGLSMEGMLALHKYPFYPLLLVVFAFAHIFWRYFVFAGFWPILEHEMTRPIITR